MPEMRNSLSEREKVQKTAQRMLTRKERECGTTDTQGRTMSEQMKARITIIRRSGRQPNCLGNSQTKVEIKMKGCCKQMWQIKRKANSQGNNHNFVQTYKKS